MSMPYVAPWPWAEAEAKKRMIVFRMEMSQRSLTDGCMRPSPKSGLRPWAESFLLLETARLCALAEEKKRCAALAFAA